jgi:hypothetical protein
LSAPISSSTWSFANAFAGSGSSQSTMTRPMLV